MVVLFMQVQVVIHLPILQEQVDLEVEEQEDLHTLQVEQVTLLLLVPLKVVQVADTSLVMELEVVAVQHKLEKMEELLV